MKRFIAFVLLFFILLPNLDTICFAEDESEDLDISCMTDTAACETTTVESSEPPYEENVEILSEKASVDNDKANESADTGKGVDDETASENAAENTDATPADQGTNNLHDTDDETTGEGETVIPDEEPVNTTPVIDPIFIDDQPNVSAWAGQNVSYSLSFYAKEGYAIRSIDLLTSTDINAFPFRIERTTYLSQYDDVSSCTYDVNLNSRADAVQNFYTVKYSVTYINLSTHEEKKQELSTVVGILQQEPEEEERVYDPVLYVSSLTSVPGEVYAGDEFELQLSLKNDSPYSVVNIKGVWDTAGNVVPINGATSFTVSGIGAYCTKTVTLRVKAGDNVQHGNYPVSVTIEYETDKKSEKQRVVEKAYITINQRVELSCSEISVYPQMPEAGQTVNIAFSIMNTGDAACQNIRIIETDSEGVVSNESVFLGEIPAGGILKAELFLSTLKAGYAHPSFKVIYEDDLGRETEMTISSEFEVAPVKVEVDIPEPEEKEKKSSGPIVVVVLGVVSIIALLVLYYFKRKIVRENG